MVSDEEDLTASEADRSPGRWPRYRRALLVLAGLLGVALAIGWLSRERIADNYIGGKLVELGLPGTYRLETVGATRQVLTDLVIGDPAHPDLTIERVTVEIDYGLLGPGLGRITLVHPRLRGSYRNGKLSFGSLDNALFGGKSKEPFRLPDLDLALDDARVRIDSDRGHVGVKLAGVGNLSGGFEGIIGMAAPRLEFGACNAGPVRGWGRLSVSRGRPRFAGPLLAESLECRANGLTLAQGRSVSEITFDPALDGFDAKLNLGSGAGRWGTASASAVQGVVSASWRKQALTAKYSLALSAPRAPSATADQLTTEGFLRSSRGSALEADGTAKAAGVAVGAGVDRTLQQLVARAEGTLVASLAAQLRSALRREISGSSFSGAYAFRRSADGLGLVVPEARLTGSGGATVVEVSRLQLTDSASAPRRISGNFNTGGTGLPRIAGRMESGTGGMPVLRLSLAPYRAGNSSIAIPQLTVAQARGGAFGFAGRATLSGPLPGGAARDLAMPLEGNWSPAQGLALWRRCTPVSFASLAFSQLTLDRRSVMLCPGKGGAIVRLDHDRLRIAAGAPALAVTGRIGATAVRIGTGPVGLAWPGTMVARTVDVQLGRGQPSRFRIDGLEARLGGPLAGRFTGSDVHLAAVPLDISQATGNWRYANGALIISAGAFRLADRQTDARFAPLIAREATLTLLNNRIAAQALLREPLSDRAIVLTTIRHDLGNGTGHADLAVQDLNFDEKLQPDTLTNLALGVIANARGIVKGSGTIDWTPARVTSGGTISTPSLDFAAAFGPARGLSGTIEFTDLLGMVTAPDQRLRIASINPGIEVTDGELSFELKPGRVLAVNGARWPFLEGTLTLEPTRMVLGVAETRRYTLVIDGLDAAHFVARMGMSNLNATGVFDGRLPLVFDENGGHIDGGVLTSRPPGGNVSYVGALTWKDLSPMANFAFDALKSIDYRQMRIELNGALQGEIVTRVSFDGIKQGQGARRNFLTNRIGKLPIRFNVNIRAPFFKLVNSVRSLYDPDFVPDPRELGIVGADGKTPARPLPGIQPPVSEKTP